MDQLSVIYLKQFQYSVQKLTMQYAYIHYKFHFSFRLPNNQIKFFHIKWSNNL